MAGKEELAKTLESLKGNELVSRILVMQSAKADVAGVDGVLGIDTLKSSRTMRAPWSRADHAFPGLLRLDGGPSCV